MLYIHGIHHAHARSVAKERGLLPREWHYVQDLPDIERALPSDTLCLPPLIGVSLEVVNAARRLKTWAEAHGMTITA
jgi:hypothetical protein